jgi:hypothetical protein
MPKLEKSHVQARYLRDGTPWMPQVPENRSVDMAREDGPTVRFKLSSHLASTAVGKKDSDKWRCSLSVVGERQAEASKPYEFDYSMGVGHRTKLRGGPRDGDMVPTEPTCRSVLVSLGMDASTALDMPLDMKRAAAYVQSELGYERADEAIAVTERLRDAADRLRSMLGHVGVSLEDFAAFGREIEATPEPKQQDRDGFDIYLPEAEKDGEAFKAIVRVEFSAITREARDIDGNPVPADARRLSMTASVLSRRGGKGRWDGRLMGQSVGFIRDAWADHPVVQEMCDVWDKWHLNDMRSGTRAQAEAVAALRAGGVEATYDACVEHLGRIGLLTDDSVVVGGKPYRYGTAWLAEPLPVEIEERLREMRADVAGDKPTPQAAGPRM